MVDMGTQLFCLCTRIFCHFRHQTIKIHYRFFLTAQRNARNCKDPVLGQIASKNVEFFNLLRIPIFPHLHNLYPCIHPNIGIETAGHQNRWSIFLHFYMDSVHRDWKLGLSNTKDINFVFRRLEGHMVLYEKVFHTPSQFLP